MTDEHSFASLLLSTRSLAPPEGYQHRIDEVQSRNDSSTIRLPGDLRELWDSFLQVRLFEDVEYGQWGLILWGRALAGERQQEEAFNLRERNSFVEGDIVVGEFLGDTDRVVVRTDPDAQDFGVVLVALGIDPRSEWPSWPSLSDFVSSFISHDGEKYWPH